MKKVFFILGVSLIALSTGCGNQKKLECTLVTDTAGYGTQEQKYTLVFKDDKVSKQTVSTVINLSEAMKDYETEFFNSFKASYDELKDKKGIEVSASDENGVIKGYVVTTIGNLDDSSRKSSTIDQAKNYEAFKKEFTDNGYTCK